MPNTERHQDIDLVTGDFYFDEITPDFLGGKVCARKKLSRRDFLGVTAVAGGGAIVYSAYKGLKKLNDWVNAPLDALDQLNTIAATVVPTKPPTATAIKAAGGDSTATLVPNKNLHPADRPATQEPTKERTTTPKNTEVAPQIRGDGFEVYKGEFESVKMKFPEIPAKRNLNESSWTVETLMQNWSTSIKEAQETGIVAEINLPEGEIVFDQKVELQVPERVEVIFKGHEKGSRITLTPHLADLPQKEKNLARSWSGREFNALEIRLAQGSKISVEGIEWEGGKKTAGEGGYTAPAGPWNTILGIYGNGNGVGTNPGGDFKGEATVKNCTFRNSEAPGLVMQNLDNAVFDGNSGEKLDTLVTANWNRSTVIRNSHAKDCLSDAFFFVVCDGVKIEDCSMDVARQGLDFHGCSNVVAQNVHGRQCAEFITISRAEVNDQPCQNIKIEDCHSTESNLAYAIQFVDGLTIKNGIHDKAGEWWNENDFLHTGIERRDSLAAVALWLDKDSTKNARFSDVWIRKSPQAPDRYRVDKRPEGVRFVYSDDENSLSLLLLLDRFITWCDRALEDTES